MRSQRFSRLSALAGAVAAVWLMSCDLSVTPGSFYSISRLLRPLPGVVLGDTMRDSTGTPAPLRVLAFSATGLQVNGITPYFIVLDTGIAHLSGGTLLVGDKEGQVRVVGGVGNVQTLPETVKVTLKPDTIVASDSVHHLKTYSVLTDTIVNSAELGALVQHRVGATTSAVDAVIVKYTIVYAPSPKSATATVVLLNGGLLSSVDTTLSGRAGRTVQLRVNQLTSVNLDSAIVRATASYRGVTLGSVLYTVVFKNQ